MPTNRRRTPRSRKVSALNQGEINFLYDRDEPLDNPWNDLFFMSEDEIKALWENNRDEVLTWWIDNQPCTRPGPWWKYDAPKELVADCDGSEFFAYQAFRKRVGGIGTPAHEISNTVPHFILGIPVFSDYLSFCKKWVAIDPDDPPAYESQAAYLHRNDLLTKEEVKHLKKNPELLAAEEVTE